MDNFNTPGVKSEAEEQDLMEQDEDKDEINVKNMTKIREEALNLCVTTFSIIRMLKRHREGDHINSLIKENIKRKEMRELRETFPQFEEILPEYYIFDNITREELLEAFKTYLTFPQFTESRLEELICEIQENFTNLANTKMYRKPCQYFYNLLIKEKIKNKWRGGLIRETFSQLEEILFKPKDKKEKLKLMNNIKKETETKKLKQYEIDLYRENETTQIESLTTAISSFCVTTKPEDVMKDNVKQETETEKLKHSETEKKPESSRENKSEEQSDLDDFRKRLLEELTLHESKEKKTANKTDLVEITARMLLVEIKKQKLKTMKTFQVETRIQLQCEHCSNKYANNSELWKHIKLSHGNAYECAECGNYETSEMTSFQNHTCVQIQLQKYANQVRCEHCSNKYANNSKLWKHMKMSHGNAYECAECGNYETSEMTSFQNHTCVQIQHQKYANQVKCEHCNKKYANSSRLWNHMKMIHGNVYKCTECSNYKTCKLSLFQNHTCIQLQCQKYANRIKCEHCNQMFGDNNQLEKHMNSAHKDAYKCTECKNYETCKMSAFQKHECVRVNHWESEKKEQLKNKNIEFKCDKCGYRCTRNSQRMRHMKERHSNDLRHLKTTKSKAKRTAVKVSENEAVQLEISNKKETTETENEKDQTAEVLVNLKPRVIPNEQDSQSKYGPSSMSPVET